MDAPVDQSNKTVPFDLPLDQDQTTNQQPPLTTRDPTATPQTTPDDTSTATSRSTIPGIPANVEFTQAPTPTETPSVVETTPTMERPSIIETPVQTETYVKEVPIPTEILQNNEVKPIEKPTQTQPQKTQTKQIETTTSEPEIPKKIIDKTDELTTLHDVKTRDKLTNKADDEEEEFIENVQAAHDDN